PASMKSTPLTSPMRFNIGVWTGDCKIVRKDLIEGIIGKPLKFFLQRFGAIFRSFPQLICFDLFSTGSTYSEDGVALEVRISGTHLGSWRDLPPTGRRVSYQSVRYIDAEIGKRNKQVLIVAANCVTAVMVFTPGLIVVPCLLAKGGHDSL